MFEIEPIVLWLQSLPAIGVYAFLFATTFIENLFPPSPSDVVLLFIATLVGIGTIDFVPTLLIATAGSVAGFLSAFLIGRRFGRSLAESEKFPFLNRKTIAKVDTWFDKYGYGVIVLNRFLSGTRAVVSFIAGMSELDLLKTTLFCTVSAVAWNAIVISLGNLLGDNWERGQEILATYGRVVMYVMIGLAVIGLAWWLYRRKNPRPNDDDSSVDESTTDIGV